MPYKHKEEWERRKQALRSDEDFYAAEAEATKDVFDTRLGLVRPGRECARCGEMRVDRMCTSPNRPDGHKRLCRKCKAKTDGTRERRNYDRPGRVYVLHGNKPYVGYTAGSLWTRFFFFDEGHANSKPWWDEVTHITVYEFATGNEALAFECAEIARLGIENTYNESPGWRSRLPHLTTPVEVYETTPEEVRAAAPVQADSSYITNT